MRIEPSTNVLLLNFTYGSERKVQHHLVDVAPSPVFSRLKRSDNGMVAVVKVLGGMLVGRRVAASHVPAGHAQAQVDPPGSGLQAILAPARRAGGHYAS